MQAEVQRYWIPPHVRVCPLLASTVLLDLKRNRYFGIGTEETRALSTLALNWHEANGSAAPIERLTLESAVAMADALVEAGLLSRDAPREGALATTGIDLSGTLTSVGHELVRSAPVRLAHLSSFLMSLAWTASALRIRTLYSIACEVRDRRLAGGGRFDADRAIELVSVFRRMRPHLFAAKDRCLFHALALVRFLARHGIFPTWVIGVRVKPWSAHSWVQHGRLLLDSNPEHVCEYTPILTV